MSKGILYVQYNDGTPVESFTVGGYTIDDGLLWILSSSEPVIRFIIPMHRVHKVSEIRDVEGSVH